MVTNNNKNKLIKVDPININNLYFLQIHIKVGPVDKFDDGQPNFIQLLRDSFDTGLPIIKELEPYINKKQPKEVYNFRILSSSDEFVGEPNLFACSLFDYILEEIGLRSYIRSYRQNDDISYDVLEFIKLLLYGRILNPQSNIATVRQNDNYYTILLDEGAYEYNVFDTLNFVYKHRKAFFNRIDAHMRKKLGSTTNKIYYDITNFFFEIDNPDIEIDEDDNETGIRFCGVSKEHIIAHLSLCTISLLILRIIQNQIKLKHLELKKDDIKYTFSLSTDRIKTALLKWQVEKLVDEYCRFNNTNDKYLSIILDSFNLKFPKQLYSKLR